jgi:hypothetical protein
MKMKDGYRWIRLAVVGPKRNGKTCLVPSVLKTLAIHFARAVVQVVNSEAAYATSATALHVGAAPSKSGTRDKVTVKFHELRLVLEISVWPAEDLLFERGIDVPKLDQQFEAEGIDVHVIVTNTFQHDPDLAAYSYVELCWSVQQKAGLSLGSVCRLANKLLFSTVREEDFAEEPAQAKTGGKHSFQQYAELRELNAGFKDITDAQLRDGRIVRAPDAKFGLPIHDCFRVDGCDNGQQIVNTLIRTAQTVGANPIELLNMRAVLSAISL